MLRGRTATLIGTTTALLLLPTAAGAEGHGYTNHREVPNNACGPDTPVATFVDRDAASTVHQRSIDCVNSLGIAAGRDGGYHPSEDVTRAQMASFIARSLEAAGDRDLPDEPDRHFDDTEGSTHEHRIDQLAEVGVVRGTDADRYDPSAAVTRAQMASFLLRAASWNHTGTTDAYTPAGDDAYFLDVAAGSAHGDAIRTGYELALFEGRQPGEYAPSLAVHRGAMATFLTRLMDLVHPDAYRTTNQTYLMSPMEAIETNVGEPIEFSVDRSRATGSDGVEWAAGPVRQSLHIALFACRDVDTAEGAETFADLAGDGLADGLGSSDEGHAYLRDVQGEPVQGQETMVRNVSPDEDGTISFTVIADQPDCVVAVAFDDRAPQDELRLDVAQRPANAFGYVIGSWS